MNSRFPPEISNHQPLIRLRQVVKVYRTAAGDFPALKGLDLDVEAGEFLAITGKSGAGKTTLVNMITGTDALTSGVVEVGGVNIHQLDENRRALWRGRHLGVIYQSFHLLPNLTLLDNILLPMDFCGLYRRRASRERAMDLLRQMEMADHAHKLPSQISGGQQQRVAIARAIVNEPAIILADEPTGNLDSQSGQEIMDLLLSLNARSGTTLIIVTHDQGVAAQAQRIIHLKDGLVDMEENGK